MGWLCVFLTKKALTVEPTVVNTVSNKTWLVENESFADESVSTVSFLQDERKPKQMPSAIAAEQNDFVNMLNVLKGKIS